MRRLLIIPAVLLLVAGLVAGAGQPASEVKVERVACLNLPNCLRLSNGQVEVIVTTDVGPRIIGYAFVGETNLLGEVADESVETALGEWKPWGGHRLWTAPEIMPRTYAPDNGPVQHAIDGNAIRLTQPADASGVQKEMTVTLEPAGSAVTVLHRITNRTMWDIELAPWALTIMNGGGEVILPQEPYRAHAEYLLPARPMVVWHYTDLSDPRWTLGARYIRLRTDANRPEPQKMGIANKQGWGAYLREGTLFVKRFAWQEGATYADYGSNTETYTAGTFIELETLGPLVRLEPGATAGHTERWWLFRQVDVGDTEETLDAALRPLIAQTSFP